MKREVLDLDQELESLLRFRPAARRVPDDVRARVLARSRASVSAHVPARVPARPTISRAVPFTAPIPPTPSASQGSGLRRLAIAAALAILVEAAGAVAALRARTAGAPAGFSESSVSVPAHLRDETVPDSEPPPGTGAAAATTASHHALTSRRAPAPEVRGADSLAEVELLQRAHLAYARRDFRATLALVAEHRRRFPSGPLAEECEALRVESLLAAGRTVEAKRASATFSARFPRSVLLPGIEQTFRQESIP